MARGGLVVKQALSSAPSENRLADDSFNNLANEPLTIGSQLWVLPCIIITPYITVSMPI
ncbi:NAD(P)-dependent oxidoreductase [Chloroflexota bacterium]